MELGLPRPSLPTARDGRTPKHVLKGIDTDTVPAGAAETLLWTCCFPWAMTRAGRGPRSHFSHDHAIEDGDASFAALRLCPARLDGAVLVHANERRHGSAEIWNGSFEARLGSSGHHP